MIGVFARSGVFQQPARASRQAPAASLGGLCTAHQGAGSDNRRYQPSAPCPAWAGASFKAGHRGRARCSILPATATPSPKIGVAQSWQSTSSDSRQIPKHGPPTPRRCLHSGRESSPAAPRSWKTAPSRRSAIVRGSGFNAGVREGPRRAAWPLPPCTRGVGPSRPARQTLTWRPVTPRALAPMRPMIPSYTPEGEQQARLSAGLLCVQRPVPPPARAAPSFRRAPRAGASARVAFWDPCRGSSRRRS